MSLIDPDGFVVDTVTDEEPLPEYSGTLTVPADGPCGAYTVLAEGEENDVIESSIEVTFTVPCPETTTTTATEEIVDDGRFGGGDGRHAPDVHGLYGADEPRTYWPFPRRASGSPT